MVQNIYTEEELYWSRGGNTFKKVVENFPYSSE